MTLEPWLKMVRDLFDVFRTAAWVVPTLAGASLFLYAWHDIARKRRLK